MAKYITIPYQVDATHNAEDKTWTVTFLGRGEGGQIVYTEQRFRDLFIPDTLAAREEWERVYGDLSWGFDRALAEAAASGSLVDKTQDTDG